MQRSLIVLLTAVIVSIPAAGAERKVYFLLQNQFSAADVASLQIEKGVSISGSSLCWKKGDSVEKALSYTATDIEAVFASAVKSIGIVDHPGTCIVLDLEHPVHPKEFHGLGGTMNAVVAAFANRIRIARKQLPRSKLALYGILNPQPQGEYTEEFIRQFAALRSAGKLGMYDDIDYIVPVLYTRFGSNDSERQRSGWEHYIRMGLEASSLMVCSDGNPVPLAPILSSRVLNGGSRNEYDPVPADAMKKILAILAEYESVHAVLFWEGWDGYPLKPGEASMEIKGAGGTRTIYPLDMEKYFRSISPADIMTGARSRHHDIPAPLKIIVEQ
ncbi:MAG: hypothetical protein AABZ39_00960 [Spirochaetota bacterium]